VNRTAVGLPARLVATGVGAAVGASAWISAGVLAVVEATRVTRVGALPSTTWLLTALAVGAIVGAVGLPRLRRWAPLSLLVFLWLPWLPWPMPAACLLWEGPLEVAIWTATTAGLLWAVGAGRARPSGLRALVAPTHAPWMAAAVSAAVCATAWFIDRPRVPAGDEPHYLVIAQSLLTDGDLRIENNHRNGDYLAYYDGVLKPDFMRRGTDREIYSIHAPGVSLLALPVFALAGYPGAVLLVIAIAAVAVALTWSAAFTLTGSPGGAWMAAAGLAVSAPFVLHGFTIYPDPVGATLVMVAVSTLVARDRQLEVSTARWLWTGTALALLPWLHTRFALLAGALGAALAVRQMTLGGARAMAPLLAVPIVSAAAWFGYFWVIYGTPNPAAPYGVSPGGGPSFVPTGLAGLLVDQQFGLAAHAPILAAGAASLLLLTARRRRLGLELALTAGLYLGAAASYPMWWGGYSAPARFAVAVLPLLALPLAVAWTAAPAALRAALAALLAVSAAVSTALVVIDRGAFIYNGRDGYDLLLDWLNRTVDVTLAAPSVHRDGAAAAMVVAFIWAISAVFVTATVARLSGVGSGAAGRVGGWLAVPAGMMAAVTVAWAGEPREAVTPSTSQMSLLGRWRQGSSDLVLQITPTRRLDVAEVPRRLSLAGSPRGPRRADPPLLQIPQLPAGTFDVFAETAPGAVPSGTGVVRLGRHDLPLDTWRFDERPAGFTGLVLSLPVPAHSITVTGDATATASIRALSLRPRTLLPLVDASLVALRAMRVGGIAVYALDDNAYLEPGALWVRGERTAQLVIAADAGTTPRLRLKAGRVANQVDLRAGRWSQRIALAPDAEVDVTLPVDALAPGAVSVTSATGFRPSADGTGDVRWLGVYLTWRGAAPTPAASP
jgi:hypothetical protein